MSAQISLFDPMIVDNFAGGGGASTGIEMATGRPVDIAINHDESAILMHERNHPYTQHYQDDVWILDPVKLTGGRPVHIAWFSPDCKHFSRAKGAALVDRKIRGLAWVVCKWAGLTKPDIILLENVPEFVTWGPVRKGKPVKSKAGQTFKKWKSQLEDLGYHIEYRELCAADYGTPTIRTRFCLIARRDGKPIQWPEPTHAPRNSEAVRSGRLKPWRAAAEIIDWTQPSYSIFDSKATIKARFGVTAVRPLANNTMSRIAKGMDKFVLKNAEPFIMCNNANNAPHGMDEPMPTVTTGNRNFLVTPILAQHKFQNAAQSVEKPLTTITAVGAHEVITPFLAQYHSETNKDARGQDLRKPLLTVDASNRYGLVAPILNEWYGNARDGLSMREPVQTLTGKDREALISSHLAHFKGKDKGQDMRDPLMTVTASDGQFGHVTTVIAKYSGGDIGHWPEVRDMLNKYCAYTLKNDEVLLLMIGGSAYYIRDITLRMLTPREMYNAMGFPPDYIIDRDVYGRPIPRAAQVARCGNAVCPPLAAAIVRANCPEMCPGEIHTMEELREVMTA